MSRLKALFKAQPVLVIAFFAALVTVFFIPPDAEYIGYLNRTVLIQLFGLMTAVAGVRSVGLFDAVTEALLAKAGNVRRLGCILMLICFFSSMLVTNDVVLLTFVPMTLLLFRRIPDEKSRILTVVLETAAANLGSMLTPVGNPQNLFLYDRYRLTAGEFLRVLLPFGALSLACLTLLCRLLPRTPCEAGGTEKRTLPRGKTAVYLTLFAVCLLCVFRLIPDWAVLIAAVGTALAADRSLLKKVDYALLATFVCFFVFVGNVARVEAVSVLLRRLLAGREMLVSVLLSQGISNVPAAVMLAGFTENGKALLLGANLGGLGTMIASLASLISFQFYRKSEGAQTARYFRAFSAVNFGLLAVLLVLALILKR